MTDGPLEDTIAEAHRVADAAKSEKLGVKLLGGAGIHLHSESAQRAPLKRKYGDLDYAMPSRDRKRVLAFFPALGLRGQRAVQPDAGRPAPLFL